MLKMFSVLAIKGKETSRSNKAETGLLLALYGIPKRAGGKMDVLVYAAAHSSGCIFPLNLGAGLNSDKATFGYFHFL